MSIGSSGLSSLGPLQPVTIAVAPTHPLIQLAQVIPWQALAQLVLPDLQHTTAKGKWWIGRVLLNESETSHFQDTPFREIVTKRPR